MCKIPNLTLFLNDVYLFAETHLTQVSAGKLLNCKYHPPHLHGQCRSGTYSYFSITWGIICSSLWTINLKYCAAVGQSLYSVHQTCPSAVARWPVFCFRFLLSHPGCSLLRVVDSGTFGWQNQVYRCCELCSVPVLRGSCQTAEFNGSIMFDLNNSTRVTGVQPPWRQGLICSLPWSGSERVYGLMSVPLCPLPPLIEYIVFLW